MVAAVHVTTHNLGGKKSVVRKVWHRILIVAIVNFVDFSM